MPDLSPRERQILKMLLAEYSQNEISNALELSYSRVNDVKTNIMNKWNVTTMVGLVKESIKQGYLDVEDWEIG
jgi:DNA-binding CsgD family transcriptional regulator